MIQPSGIIIRFAADINKWNGVTPTDANTSAAVIIPTGADLLLQLFFSQGNISDANRVDFTNIATVYIALQSQSNPHNATIYWSSAIANAAINNACTVANWQAGTDQQISVAVPNASNAFQAPQGSQNYWLVIYALTNDATPKQIVFSASQVQVVDSGLPIATPTLPQPFKVGTTLNFVCSDALTRSVNFKLLGNGRWTLDIEQTGHNGPGQATYALYCTDGQYRDLTVIQVQGAWTLDVGQNGHS